MFILIQQNLLNNETYSRGSWFDVLLFIDDNNQNKASVSFSKICWTIYNNYILYIILYTLADCNRFGPSLIGLIARMAVPCFYPDNSKMLKKFENKAKKYYIIYIHRNVHRNVQLNLETEEIILYYIQFILVSLQLDEFIEMFLGGCFENSTRGPPAKVLSKFHVVVTTTKGN